MNILCDVLRVVSKAFVPLPERADWIPLMSEVSPPCEIAFRVISGPWTAPQTEATNISHVTMVIGYNCEGVVDSEARQDNAMGIQGRKQGS